MRRLASVILHFIEVAAICVGLIAALILAIYVLLPAPRTAPALIEQTGSAPLVVVALGDSYMSGEGAGVYFEGTDNPGFNSCRRAPTAYPVRVTERLGKDAPNFGFDHVQLVFTACSGARTYNIGDSFPTNQVSGVIQYPGEPSQISVLREHPGADVVLVGAGGNDARFSEVIGVCAGRQVSCIERVKTWLDDLEKQLPGQLRDLYSQIASTVDASALIYATTYPDPFSTRECANVGLDEAEVGFLRDVFIKRLNEHIEFAAFGAGVEVIRLEDVFRDQGLCASEGSHGPALNAFLFQKTAVFNPNIAKGFYFAESLRGSFHPTDFGHQLIASAVSSEVERDLAASVRGGKPLPEPQICPPGMEEPCYPTEPPPEVGHVGTPLGPWPLPENPCSTVALERQFLEHASRIVIVRDAQPASLVCYRTFKSAWRETLTDSSGSAEINFKTAAVAGLGGWREVIFRAPDERWVWLSVVPPPDAVLSDLDQIEAWLGIPRWLAISTLAISILIPAIFVHSKLHSRVKHRPVAASTSPAASS